MEKLTHTKELTKAFNIEVSDSDNREGWFAGRPVGIKINQWPRSRVNGLPMAHIWTFLVPKEYRVKGSDYIAISLFQADDHVAEEIKEVESVINDKKEVKDSDAQKFWDSLLEYSKNRHSMEIYLEDIIDGGWVLIWLTKEEFDSKQIELPNEDNSVHPEYDYEDYGNCFAQDDPPRYVKLIERENDPNIGIKLDDWPDEEDENAYINMHSKKGEKLKLKERFWGKTHFGGTANPCQANPGFSPYYIEFEEGFGNANMGGGNGQIDLLNDELDWAQ
ncbi:hypothetical protein [Flavivirga jejuensis]|uniref:Uncharacterized protein n=1 Tax=Flavivirga jejuensis TaxID=870487 RepID=A0ABT8WJS3_9FLAO|nr:hypothetical protein [Flavivirga jejuensis]MDO5973368.1 hypothetical protein [Flavivirga jejuensis]